MTHITIVEVAPQPDLGSRQAIGGPSARRPPWPTQVLFRFPPFSSVPLLLLVMLKPVADAFYEVDAVKYGYMFLLAFASLFARSGIAITGTTTAPRDASLLPLFYLTIFYFLFLFGLAVAYPGYLPEIFKILSPFVFFLLVAFATDRWMLYALAVGAALTICVNAALLPFDLGWTTWGSVRTFKGYYYFKTDLAYALCFSVLILAIFSRNSITTVGVVLVALAAVQIVLANSRLNYLTFLIVVLFLAFKSGIRLRSIIQMGLLLGILALVFLLVYDPTKMLGFEASNDAAFTQGRSVIWEQLIDSLLGGTPIQWAFGRGLFADLLLSAEHVSVTNGTAANAHNEFIHLLFTQGILGIVSYTLLWIQIFRYARRPGLPQWAQGTVFLGVLLFLIQGMTAVMSSYATKTWPLVTVFLALRAASGIPDSASKSPGSM